MLRAFLVNNNAIALELCQRYYKEDYEDREYHYKQGFIYFLLDRLVRELEHNEHIEIIFSYFIKVLLRDHDEEIKTLTELPLIHQE